MDKPPEGGRRAAGVGAVIAQLGGAEKLGSRKKSTAQSPGGDEVEIFNARRA